MEYLYVCHFSNGHIKVGRSINPASRIASHVERVSCVGIELIEHHSALCVGRSAPAEAELISKCAELATAQYKNEWFSGIDFQDACAFANDAANSRHERSLMNVLTLIEELGGTNAVAGLLNLKPPSVSDWKSNGRIPDDKLIRLAVIAESRGICSRKELFPSDFGTIWPELVEVA